MKTTGANLGDSSAQSMTEYTPKFATTANKYYLYGEQVPRNRCNLTGYGKCTKQAVVCKLLCFE